MNKKPLVLVLVIVLSIVGGVIYLLKTDQTQPIENQSQTSTPNEKPVSPSSGAYVDYSDGIIAETSGTKLIFFHAPWCPQCRALDADIKSRSVPEGVTIIKADYDTSQELRQKYGVTIQTTVVRVDDSGNLVEKFVAYDDPTLESIKLNLL